MKVSRMHSLRVLAAMLMLTTRAFAQRETEREPPEPPRAQDAKTAAPPEAESPAIERPGDEPSGDAKEADPAVAARAQALYEQGLAAYARQAYSEAITLFEQARALDDRPEILFAQAQAVRLGGDCERALPLYRKFLESQPPQRQVDATALAMKRCESLAPKVAVATDVPRGPGSTDVSARATGPSSVSSPSSSRSIFHDRAGAWLAAGALVTGVIGGAFIWSAHDRAEEGGTSYQQNEDNFATAQQRFAIGVGALVTAGVLASASAFRYLWISMDAERDGPRLSLGGRF